MWRVTATVSKGRDCYVDVDGNNNSICVKGLGVLCGCRG